MIRLKPRLHEYFFFIIDLFILNLKPRYQVDLEIYRLLFYFQSLDFEAEAE